MDRARSPAVAGSFYPSAPDELRQALANCFDVHPLGPGQIAPGQTKPAVAFRAGMVPHAGYIYSGPCAAHWYSNLDPAAERVILLGVNHSSRGPRAALSPWPVWQTPLGVVPVDLSFNEVLKKQVQFLSADESAHLEEHSIEVQLPFLERVLTDFWIVPISLSLVDLAECADLGAAIAAASQSEPAVQRKTCILASSDLSHYLSPEETDVLDDAALEPIIALDPAGLLKVVHEKKITMCGALPTAVMLYAAKALGASHARLLKHYHSG
ncbi:MAG TPA: AmmeMemoRadiSam system protein B, partial [Candidatus Binatia bacterium]|nr:AmmeMemoRadiSam system protein B [Candidatus Binatia bacterium]